MAHIVRFPAMTSPRPAARRRLRETRGATVVFALLGLLMAALASAAILAAATGSARVTAAHVTNDQDFLAVSGAAAIVRDEIVGGDGAPTELGVVARAMAGQVEEADPPVTATTSLTLEVTGDAGAARALGDVSVTIEVDAALRLAVTAERGTQAVRLEVPAAREDGQIVWRSEDVVAVAIGRD